MQYNVTAEEYETAYAEYLAIVQKEEARQQYLSEVRYRDLYGNEEDDDEGSDQAKEDLDDEDEEETAPAVAEYKFFSTTRSSRGMYEYTFIK